MKQDDKFVAALKDVTKKIITSTKGDTESAAKFRRYFTIGAIVAGVVIVLAGIVALVGYQNVKKAERLMAQADTIYRAMVVTKAEYESNPTFRTIGAYVDATKKWSDAAEAYEAVIGNHENTNYGILALLYSGNCYYQLGEYDEAIDKYEKYIKKAGRDAPFALMTRQSIGYCYEALDRLDDAEEVFLSLTAEEGSTVSILSLFDVARIYQAKKEYQKALDSLKKIDSYEAVKSPQFYQFKKDAEAKIKTLQALVEQGST